MKGAVLVEWRGKRLFDIAISLTAALLTAPLQLAAALAVAITMGRPILFRQQRVGADGTTFELVKFRTMVRNAHEVSNGYPSATLIPPVGRFLRKTSLDELPQLWNIVIGDMSLVGPRPALPDQVARYSLRQKQRLQARPGITGLAQIRFRNSAPWSVRIESDIEYIERMSPAQDVQILARTIPAVLFGTGVQTGQTADDVDDLGSLPDD